MPGITEAREQLRDALLGQQRVNDQDDRGRHQNAERTAGGERAACKPVRIIEPLHLRQRDLATWSRADAFASAANFLRGIGWKPPLPAAEEGIPAAELPARAGRHDGREAGAHLGADGRAQGGQRGAAQLRRALVDHPCPRAIAAPPSILYPNFKAVMNWNRSTLYALSVAILAQQIAGGPPVAQGAPADDEPLSRNTVIDMQNRLRPPHPLHRPGRRPSRPQDALGGAALPEADRLARRRPSDAASFVRRLQQAR